MKEYYDWIEAYLNGSLEDEAKIEFETAMAADPNLQAAVDHFPLAKKLANSFIELETAKQIEALSKSKTNLWPLFIVVGILLVGLVYFLTRANTKKVESIPDQREQIFASLYEAPASKAERSGQEHTNALDTAIFLFENAQWEQSKIYLLKVLSVQLNDSIALRYLAHSYLHVQQLDSAQIHFQVLLGIQNPIIQNDAKYNLMILYLMQDEKARAKELFDDLKNQKALGLEKQKRIESMLE